jgi:hypothetical protein
MIVRRLLAGVLLAGLAVPALGAAPHPHEPRTPPREAIPAPPRAMTARVFARADAEADPSPAPVPASPAAPALPAASGAPAPAAEPGTLPPPAASSPSPEVAARARAEFEANRSGKIDRTHYTTEMNARISDTALAEASSALKALGPVKGFVQVRKITQGALTLYVFRIECEKPPAVEEAIAWNAAGKVDFLQFVPAR